MGHIDGRRHHNKLEQTLNYLHRYARPAGGRQRNLFI
jgi:hypothetical protein